MRQTPYFFCIIPVFNCAYFCKLIVLRLNETESQHFAFFSNTPVRENNINSLSVFDSEEQMNIYIQVKLLTSFELLKVLFICLNCSLTVYSFR